MTSLPGPGSLAWKYAGLWRLATVLGRMLVLETAHPVVGAGVAEFSTYRTRPWRRAEQTLLSLLRMLYSDNRGREKEAARLERLHSHIKGEGYSALDLEAKAWVYLTMFEGVVVMCRSGGDPLSPEDEAQLYDEWVACGALLGLGPDEMPATVADFWRYFEQMTTEKLERTQGLKDLIEALDRGFPAPRALEFLPQPLWRLLSTAGARAYADLTASLLSPELQERLGMRPSPLGAALSTVVCRGAGLLDRVLPMSLRYMPVAASAMAVEHQVRLSPQQPGLGGSEIFARILDQNDDGVLSWVDLAASARVISARLDLDEKDETALYDSFHAWWQELRDMADGDKDGTVSREEYSAAVFEGSALRAAMDAVAAGVDKDDDGYVELAEYAHLLGGAPEPDVVASFRQLDGDADGRLTVAELAVGLGEFFLGRKDSLVDRHLLGTR
ncbi:EF-hand domain-containing protein [Allokutzneria sp. NRRL B-24872]|uniref:EF-hand domain-containing protein n=1 Tax=Allokutzneria sp. NRRL B-24872 TaxID=1137961 RepID=UPI000A3C5341|nr:EF-hand domain-containing protein [Allokutzneria sp. NRRL B-24872]